MATYPPEGVIPALGDWLMPRDPKLPPGMVVAVLPGGHKVILAGDLPPNTWDLFPAGGMVEVVHDVADLKGPMNGQKARHDR